MATEPAKPATPVVDPAKIAQAARLVRDGKSSEAADLVKTAGPSGSLGSVLATAGYETEAFQVLAPADHVVDDKNVYDTTIKGSIAAELVNEATSVKRHTLKMDGKTVPFTANAGHLVAKGPKGEPEVAIFYTAYIRDGLPKENRPVTFFWNGGPGSSSIWLHLGSWAPWRIKSDAPNMPSATQPESLPFEENAITLLDKSDLVFVDPAGTGYSTAIAPHTNNDFWGIDSDPRSVADFILRYVNVNNRQSSPKYLYGESYGGIRTPIVADILTQAGVSRYEPDPSGKPAKTLSGLVLNSPILNYNSSCDPSMFYTSCAGFIPSYGLVADALGKSTVRGTRSRSEYLDYLREYTKTTFAPIAAKYGYESEYGVEWEDYAPTDEGKAFLAELSSLTGISSKSWSEDPVYGLVFRPIRFREGLIPGFKLGRYDARMMVPVDSKFAADDYIDVAFLNRAKTFFPDYTNYKTKSEYVTTNEDDTWDWKHRDQFVSPSSLGDMTEALRYEPKLKLLTLHGYDDIATPGYQTELDLISAGLETRMPVKWFEGGHMIYNTEESRAPLKTELDKYYDDPNYSLPPATN